MEGQERGRLRSFLLGGLLGASAALAAVARRRHGEPKRRTLAGLAAFEDAPCYRETLERESARLRS